MSSTSDNSPNDYNFNDANQASQAAPNKRRRDSLAAEEAAQAHGTDAGDNGAPKAKRIACIICRKRKLKCDGTKPSCSTCTRLGHNCAYDEIRRKSGPKRGYVKALEERLKQVETLLKTQDPVDKPSETASTGFASINTHILHPPPADFDVNLNNPSIAYTTDQSADRWNLPIDPPQVPAMDDMTFNASLSMGLTMDETNFTWEMIGLGLDEPLPPQETIDELHQIYFDKIHPSMPMIHKYRYLAAMNLAPNQRPPVCLRYAMWTMACSVTDKFLDLKDHFYRRTRKYVEQDYLKGHGEYMFSVAHAQTHILLASYEFKMMFFPRAWMSTGSAVRISQMMGLHRLDGTGLDVKKCLPAPRDWTEREERRRTFWMAFCEDRYASIGTGWPMMIEERDILTNLPASEEGFENSREERTQTLPESLCPSGAASLSSFSGVILMACLFGRNLVHLHRPDPDDKDNDLNGEFWKRHRQMDNILLNTSLSLPAHLKLPNGLGNPNIVFTNMNIHTSTICLHQAAIYKADKNRLPSLVSKESKLRCITAANEIANIMRMISHLDLSSMNPFMSFCLYVSARVFVQYLKSRPDDNAIADSLRFLLSAMNAMKSKNPLTESFLVQLDVDLEGLGMKNSSYKYFGQSAEAVTNAQRDQYVCQATFGQTMQTELFSKGVDCNYGFPKSTDGHPTENSNGISQPNGYGGDSNLSSGVSATSYSANFDAMNWGPVHDYQPRVNVHPVGMQGIVPELSSMQDTTNYNPSDSTSNTHELDYSENPSDRPTPASSAHSDARPNINRRPGQNQRSGQSSLETSPADTHSQGTGNSNSNISKPNSQAHGAWSRTDVDLSAAGETAGMTPGKEYNADNAWEMQGMTPIGEGVFRELMGMGPMETFSWDGAPL